MTIKPAVFKIDAIDSYFHGFSHGGSWNGFACPLFPLEEAKRLMALNNGTEYCGQIVFDEAQDEFLFHEFEGEETAETFMAAVVDGQTLYAIGAYSWCWQDVTDSPEARLSAQIMQELAARKQAGVQVPDIAMLVASDEKALAEYLELPVTDAVDRILRRVAQ